jgi:hypothetical protein
MRSLMIVAALAALTLPARAVTLIDTGGFEGFAAGDIAGQNGWQVSGYHMGGGQAINPAMVTTMAGHGNVVEFSNTGDTQTPIELNFADISGTYRYAQASFDVYRDGSGLYNNLVFWPNGANPWGGWFWDNAANAPVGKIMPFGFGNGTVDQTPNAWTNIKVLFDITNGKGTGWVNGVLVDNDINIGTGAFTGWYFSDNNTVDQGRTPGAVGQKAYVDNLLLTAGNRLGELEQVPEPSSLALLAGGLLPLLGLRRRK